MHSVDRLSRLLYDVSTHTRIIVGGEGGGIYTSGSLSLTGLSVSYNTANAGAVIPGFPSTAASGYGGGIFVSTGTATVGDGTFIGDTANHRVRRVAP